MRAYDLWTQMCILRCLADLAGHYVGVLTDAGTQQILTIGNDTNGTTQLLIEMFKPMLILEAAHITYQPRTWRPHRWYPSWKAPSGCLSLELASIAGNRHVLSALTS